MTFGSRRYLSLSECKSYDTKVPLSVFVDYTVNSAFSSIYATVLECHATAVFANQLIFIDCTGNYVN